jgi:hypothetical protein
MKKRVIQIFNVAAERMPGYAALDVVKNLPRVTTREEK